MLLEERSTGRGGGPNFECGIGEGGRMGWEGAQPIAINPNEMLVSSRKRVTSTQYCVANL